MTNALNFVRVHKSITDLEPVSLPDFTVLTGVNGSGKTHLLMGIQGGQIASSLVADLAADVRVFDSSNIVPKDTGSFDPAADQTKRSQLFQVIEAFRDKQFASLQQSVINLGVPNSLCLTASRIDSITVESLNSIFNELTRAEQVHAHIRTLLKTNGTAVGQQVNNNIGDEKWRKSAQRLLERSPEQFITASQADFFRNKDFLWGDVDPFQQAFGQVFATYRSLVHENDRLEKYPPQPPALQKFLSEQDFWSEYGTPPWDFVNRILETSNLDFRVDCPPMYETVSYEPKLRKQSKDVEMRFQDLSSGEKVLMSFALCIYNSQESRQPKSFPKLLLLDEIDAPLHPSMAAALISTIQNVLVREMNVAVILTTHSPSTVALAPDESIYAMDPTGPRVTKVSKGKALTLLTAGVPTLSVSFSGRRQVFVESKTDARLFDSLYQRYKSRLDSERSLAFVEVGRSNEAGLEQSGGCAQVIRLVKSLSDAGNESVLGLIDWDGKNERDARIHVLSQGLRDGLETAIFDPLLVVATLARDEIRVARSHDLLEDAETYQSLHVWDEARWQVAVNKLQTLVLGSEQASAADSTEVSYLSGISLNIRNAYLRMDDHSLEAAILAKFPELKARNRHAGELMRHMLDTVLSDFEMFLPKDVLASLNGLLVQEFG
jgi:ABC-type molybdenum transport system ATPase subunit/photorepair protein PhrA